MQNWCKFWLYTSLTCDACKNNMSSQNTKHVEYHLQGRTITKCYQNQTGTNAIIMKPLAIFANSMWLRYLNQVL